MVLETGFKSPSVTAAGTFLFVFGDKIRVIIRLNNRYYFRIVDFPTEKVPAGFRVRVKQSWYPVYCPHSYGGEYDWAVRLKLTTLRYYLPTGNSS